ncbi:di/tricarboxylate transporter [Roseovarius halotolerans]|uniref:Citrate transporter n=1 Tax=Roseovarius halotolerans TaxID=505353 RepID=A0A1X6ZGH7_9RHOB|nr:SLC13 family permease [Roseovarius halotolerans]RKT30763.1 di/tricarboxylate transporter [Roseovarius halotolerans]SLN49115.1 Citrate transporter [Roseovarius halotolerans]
MTTDQIILFGLFAGLFAMLIWGRYRYDLVAFSALLLGVVLGAVPYESAFTGFGHPATVIVALVLVVSAGLVNAGAVQMITRKVVDGGRSLGGHIALLGGVGAVLSGFINNVAALALLMPVDIHAARKAKRAPGLSLMPLSFATILGGMVTLIGTPPNIIIASIREEELGQSFAMFDFAPVGAVAALAGMAFITLVGWRLIPDRAATSDPADALQEASAYLAELSVPEDSDAVGKRLADLDETANSADVTVLGLIRDGTRRYGSSRGTKLKSEDVLVLEAQPEALDDFRAALGLTYTDADGRERIEDESDGLALTEAVVPRDARIADTSAQAVGLHWRQRSVIVGVSRQGRRITKNLSRAKIMAGDILLLLTPADSGPQVIRWLGCLPLAERGLSITRQKKAWLAVGLFALAVAAATLQLIPLAIGLGMVVVGYVLTGIVPVRDLYDQIEWPVVVLLGSLIPLGAALNSSGGTELLASQLIGLAGNLPAWAILAILMAMTMTLSDVLNNTATAIVAAPVAIEIARRLDAAPDAFLMAVAVGASSAFLTPIGHKNNTLILGPGGYRFSDYWRMGLPLELIVIAVSVPTIVVVWPL